MSLKRKLCNFDKQEELVYWFNRTEYICGTHHYNFNLFTIFVM